MLDRDLTDLAPGLPDVVDEKPFGKTLIPMCGLGSAFWLLLILKLCGVVGWSWGWIVLPGVADVSMGIGWALGRWSGEEWHCPWHPPA